MNKRKLAERLTKFYLRLGRGHSLIDFIVTMIKNIVYLGALGLLMNKWFGFTPPTWLIIVVGVGFEATCYTLGYIDEQVGFWKLQNSYTSKELNPYGEELLDRVKRIEDKLK